MRLRNTWVGLLGIALATTLACGGSQETSNTAAKPESPSAAGAGQKVDAATAGVVKGVVAFEGVAPTNVPIKMNADPVCMKANTTPQSQETYMVSADGKTLGNVFVYVKDGLSANYVFDVPTESAKIDQKDCRYHPHVFGMRVNQPLEIVNSDPTLHNIHAMPKGNAEFNNGQPMQNMKMSHTFDKQEVMVPFKCDVHGWMNAYVGVMSHPYFAVTKDDGKFDLPNLPPGTYTIEAWHEKLGVQTASVTIGAKESKDITFTFKPVATATN
ncbi:MAG TPA: carboxypeptidase regulatory-like domain-containing protein [Vicinamibacterales bacterium]|nr:carboxypeptidase regulatory-like domain-containing protein [Vicinamibacterales bacterium]